jgi:hypothetical protein
MTVMLTVPEPEKLDDDSGFLLQRLNDPDFRIRVCLVCWRHNRNPVYLWEVYDLCQQHKKPKPPEVTDYLAGVAQRMLSSKAQHAKDFRNVLPWIMAFPRKRRGPGRLLDPNADHPKHDFVDTFGLALLFFGELRHGRKIKEALENAASSERLPQHFADVEHATLQHWIAELMLPPGPLPLSEVEWQAGLLVGFRNFFALLGGE